MLTRLKVSGFKNLSDVDLYFGPFTCIGGPNGVGKSNLFDAIHFLSLLSSKTVLEAAALVRDESGNGGDIRSLFRTTGSDRQKSIEFEVEMIAPPEALDDLNQKAKATTNFLRYKLRLVLVDEDGGSLGPVRIQREELEHIRKRDFPQHLRFPHSQEWRDNVISSGRRTVPYISTELNQDSRIKILINRHQDGGSKGKPLPVDADTLPRTVLSRANASEAPTALCARREMESWRLLQLEPSSLRRPDPFSATSSLSSNGGHLPSTLYRLQQLGASEEERAANVQRIANRLRELIPEVRALRIDRDIKREQYTLYAKLRDGSEQPARSLSDGTLRFLALVVLEADPDFWGLVAFEEPENGIHPERIQAIVDLLKDIPVDPESANGDRLRQVIVNTHSPQVMRLVPEGSALVARAIADFDSEITSRPVRFGALAGTWRAKDGVTDRVDIMYPGAFKAYMGLPELDEDDESDRAEKRVIDREDFQQLLPL